MKEKKKKSEEIEIGKYKKKGDYWFDIKS